MAFGLEEVKEKQVGHRWPVFTSPAYACLAAIEARALRSEGNRPVTLKTRKLNG